ncbi:N-acetyltransferase [Niabella beijingensis]|uniref:N-acetyltransferase n=1 Tax=Niabella beijingensis TaxID=2872700 RepID=UPI001CBB15C4|nr:N-acetyltransferase [Niabella beijingensis]MBZ4191226.1 N-acetyltransferase [Niabella beijingensis]
MENSNVVVRLATEKDLSFATAIANEMEASAKARGTGISKRSPGLIKEKIVEGKAVVAVTGDGKWAGFIYMEPWANGSFVSHNGLIVPPSWRRKGIATLMKEKIFELTRLKYPMAKIFGITSTLATMKINTRLGLSPVAYSEIVQDLVFWGKCKSCVHYKDLRKAQFKNCFCTAMLFDPVANAAAAAVPDAYHPVPAVC